MCTALLQALRDIPVINSMKCVLFKFRLSKPQNLNGKYDPKLRLVCLLRTFKISLLHRCSEQNAKVS